ncbi:hypothetical protein CUN60_01735 [Aquella oligotrophica]|uniref:AB hydrolase-1 domain-containing protein n=2 Tax=Aquella oligotrophica TaxID=2067065 RepID=A0A2I7N3R4_9NEIS|nr:hypothetical protein CUN60_01735 [Aquella oligotrophica]
MIIYLCSNFYKLWIASESKWNVKMIKSTQSKLAGLLFGIIQIIMAQDLYSNLININGHQIHYYQTGTRGEPIVLLTGYATTSNFWSKEFISCLATNHKVYLFDYQGINTASTYDVSKLSIKSMASDVNQLVSKLNLKNAQLLGWSMGGAIALEASFQSPNLYQNLILLAPVLPTGGKTKLIQPMPEHAPFKTDSDVLNYVLNNNLYNYQTDNLKYYKSQFIQSKLEEIFPEKLVRDAQGKAMGEWVVNLAVGEQFKIATTPATFYLPTNDTIINQDTALAIAKEYPNGTIIKVKNSGHAIALQTPDTLCTNIKEY